MSKYTTPPLSILAEKYDGTIESLIRIAEFKKEVDSNMVLTDTNGNIDRPTVAYSGGIFFDENRPGFMVLKKDNWVVMWPNGIMTIMDDEEFSKIISQD